MRAQLPPRSKLLLLLLLLMLLFSASPASSQSIAALHPSSVPASAVRVSVFGADFDVGRNYSCAIAAAAAAATCASARPRSSTVIVCICGTWTGVGGAATLLVSDSSRDFYPSLSLFIAPSWTSFAPSSARASGGALIVVRGNGFDPDVAFLCVFSSEDGSAVMSQPVFPASTNQLICIVPQRDAGNSRTTQFSLSSGGLLVSSSLSAANFIFRECTTSIQSRVPAHSVAFKISGYGFTSTAEYSAVFSSAPQQPSTANLPCRRLNSTALNCACSNCSLLRPSYFVTVFSLDMDGFNVLENIQTTSLEVSIIPSVVAAAPTQAPCGYTSPLPLITLITSNLTWAGSSVITTAAFISVSGFKGVPISRTSETSVTLSVPTWPFAPGHTLICLGTNVSDAVSVFSLTPSACAFFEFISRVEGASFTNRAADVSTQLFIADSKSSSIMIYISGSGFFTEWVGARCLLQCESWVSFSSATFTSSTAASCSMPPLCGNSTSGSLILSFNSPSQPVNLQIANISIQQRLIDPVVAIFSVNSCTKDCAASLSPFDMFLPLHFYFSDQRSFFWVQAFPQDLNVLEKSPPHHAQEILYMQRGSKGFGLTAVLFFLSLQGSGGPFVQATTSMTLCVSPSITFNPPSAIQIGSIVRLSLTMSIDLAAAVSVNSSHWHVLAYVTTSIGDGVLLVLQALGTGSHSVTLAFEDSVCNSSFSRSFQIRVLPALVLDCSGDQPTPNVIQHCAAFLSVSSWQPDHFTLVASVRVPATVRVLSSRVSSSANASIELEAASSGVHVVHLQLLDSTGSTLLQSTFDFVVFPFFRIKLLSQPLPISTVGAKVSLDFDVPVPFGILIRTEVDCHIGRTAVSSTDVPVSSSFLEIIIPWRPFEKNNKGCTVYVRAAKQQFKSSLVISFDALMSDALAAVQQSMLITVGSSLSFPVYLPSSYTGTGIISCIGDASLSVSCSTGSIKSEASSYFVNVTISCLLAGAAFANVSFLQSSVSFNPICLLPLVVNPQVLHVRVGHMATFRAALSSLCQLSIGCPIGWSCVVQKNEAAIIPPSSAEEVTTFVVMSVGPVSCMNNATIAVHTHPLVIFSRSLMLLPPTSNDRGGLIASGRIVGPTSKDLTPPSLYASSSRLFTFCNLSIDFSEMEFTVVLLRSDVSQPTPPCALPQIDNSLHSSSCPSTLSSCASIALSYPCDECIFSPGPTVPTPEVATLQLTQAVAVVIENDLFVGAVSYLPRQSSIALIISLVLAAADPVFVKLTGGPCASVFPDTAVFSKLKATAEIQVTWMNSGICYLEAHSTTFPPLNFSIINAIPPIVMQPPIIKANIWQRALIITLIVPSNIANWNSRLSMVVSSSNETVGLFYSSVVDVDSSCNCVRVPFTILVPGATQIKCMFIDGPSDLIGLQQVLLRTFSSFLIPPFLGLTELQVAGDVIILPQLLVFPSNVDGRVLLQPRSSSTFSARVDVSTQAEVSFSVQSSDSSAVAVVVPSSESRVAYFSFDLVWKRAGTCVVTIMALCNCSANASSTLLYARSLPMIVSAPDSVEIINPQNNVTVNFTLQGEVASDVLIILQPNVPLAFDIHPAIVTITPASTFACVTLSYGRPGRYSLVVSSPFPGPYSGLVFTSISVLVRPLLLADPYEVVLPYQGTLVIKFQPPPLPIDAPITINILASSSSPDPPSLILNTTTVYISSTVPDNFFRIALTSTIGFWDSGSTVLILFSVNGTESSIYSRARGIAAVVRLLPRIVFSPIVYVPLLGRSEISINFVHTVIQDNAMSVRVDGGGADILILQPWNISNGIDGSILNVPVRCAPDSVVTRNLYAYIIWGDLSGASVGPIAVVCMRRSLTAEPSALSISRGGVKSFFVRCNVSPDADVTVSFKFSRDGCATLDKSSLFIPARTDPSISFAIAVTHLQPCVTSIQMQIFSLYGNYAPEGNIDNPQPVLVSLLGDILMSPSFITLSRSESTKIVVSLSPPADAPLLIVFSASGGNSSTSSTEACVRLDPASLVVTQGQSGPFILVAYHNSAGVCSFDVRVAVQSNNSIYSGFVRAKSLTVSAESYVEINHGKALQVRGGGQVSSFSVRMICRPSLRSISQIFNVTFTATPDSVGRLTLFPPYITLKVDSRSEPQFDSLFVSVAAFGAGSAADSPDEFRFITQAQALVGSEAPPPSIFVVHRLPALIVPTSPVQLPIGSSYAIPLQLSRASNSAVTVVASLVSLDPNISSVCVGIEIAPASITITARSLIPTTFMVISVSRNNTCIIKWRIISSDNEFDAAVIPELTVQVLFPMNVSAQTILIYPGWKSHLIVNCPAQLGQACDFSMFTDVAAFSPFSTILAELKSYLPSPNHVYESDSNFGDIGASIFISASSSASEGQSSVVCVRAAAASNSIFSTVRWSHGTCINVRVAPFVHLKGGGTCNIGDFVPLDVVSERQGGLIGLVRYFVVRGQGSGLRIDVNGSVGIVTCLFQGSYFVQACIYPLNDTSLASSCSINLAPVICNLHSIQMPLSAMLPRNSITKTGSAFFLPHSLIALIGSHASSSLTFDTAISIDFLSVVPTSNRVIVNAEAPVESETGFTSIAIKVVCLHVNQREGNQVTASVRALDTRNSFSGFVLDEMEVTCVSPVKILPILSTPCVNIILPPFVFSHLSIVSSAHSSSSPLSLSPSQTNATACIPCKSFGSESATLSLNLFSNGKNPRQLSLPLPLLPCSITARIYPPAPPAHLTPFSPPHVVCVQFSALFPPLLFLSIKLLPPLPHAVLNPPRMVVRGGESSALCFNVSVIAGSASFGSQVVEASIQVLGGASSTWGNLSWLIPNVAVIYPVHVRIGSAPIFVAGVPSLVSFTVAQDIEKDLLLQLQPEPSGNDDVSRHVMLEQVQSAGHGRDGILSIVCTVGRSQQDSIAFLLVSFNNHSGYNMSQQVLSRATLNITCLTSSLTLQPSAATVIVDEPFLVKLLVVQAAPPSFSPISCDPELALVSPPPALMPRSEGGFFDGIFILKCRKSGVLKCNVGIAGSSSEFTAHCMASSDFHLFSLKLVSQTPTSTILSVISQLSSASSTIPRVLPSIQVVSQTDAPSSSCTLPHLVPANLTAECFLCNIDERLIIARTDQRYSIYYRIFFHGGSCGPWILTSTSVLPSISLINGHGNTLRISAAEYPAFSLLPALSDQLNVARAHVRSYQSASTIRMPSLAAAASAIADLPSACSIMISHSPPIGYGEQRQIRPRTLVQSFRPTLFPAFLSWHLSSDIAVVRGSGVDFVQIMIFTDGLISSQMRLYISLPGPPICSISPSIIDVEKGTMLEQHIMFSKCVVRGNSTVSFSCQGCAAEQLQLIVVCLQ